MQIKAVSAFYESGKVIMLSQEKIKSGQSVFDDLSQGLYFPKFFEVETVNACNARCLMCTINDWSKRESLVMDSGLWDKFLEEIKEYSHWIDRVNLSRDGEPLLDKDLTSKVKDLKAANIRYITFSTNGSLLDQEKSRSLLAAGLDDIMFSIDGATKQTFEKIRIGLNFEAVVENCMNFIRMRDAGSYETTIRVRMVLLDKNKHELDTWFDFWRPLLRAGDRVYAKPAHSWGNQLAGHEKMAESIRPKDYSGQPCISPWSTMIIKVNGDIPLCPVDFQCRFFMGNLRNSSIKEIWHCDGFEKVRAKLLAGQRDELGLCKDCYLWDRSTIIEQEVL